jgi:hypothetical protein
VLLQAQRALAATETVLNAAFQPHLGSRGSSGVNGVTFHHHHRPTVHRTATRLVPLEARRAYTNTTLPSPLSSRPRWVSTLQPSREAGVAPVLQVVVVAVARLVLSWRLLH